jgi:hypothetical protein
MNQQATNSVRALLQGFTGAGLFRRLTYPGAPSAFIDPHSADELRIHKELDNYFLHLYDGEAVSERNDAKSRRRAEIDKEAVTRAV